MATVTIGNNTGDTHSGTEDTYLKENDPTTNYDASNINVFKYAVGDSGTGLIRFSGLSNLIALAPLTVTAASLFLFIDGDGSDANHDISVYTCLRNWVETEATWNIYSTGNNWASGGAQGSGTDRGASSLCTTTVDFNSIQYYEFTSAAFITDISNIINGVRANNGWLLDRTDAGINDATFGQFVRSEGTDAKRPYLSVTYTAGGGATTKMHKITKGVILGMNRSVR